MKDLIMKQQKFQKMKAAILVLALMATPVSAMERPSRGPIVINLPGPTIPSQPVVSPSQDNSKTKLIKFSLGTQEQVGYNPRSNCPSQFEGTITGSGKGTHLGIITLAASDCITPMQNYFTSSGNLTITAANGDTLIGNYSGSFIPTDTPNIYMYDNFIINISVGTGRFIGATGSGTMEGTSNVKTGQGVVEGTMNVTY